VLEERERVLVDALLASADVQLPIATPPEVLAGLRRAREVIAAVAGVFGDAAKTPYFETSLLRYEHYLAIAQTFPPKARILEIGSAPGHVSVGLSLLGFDLDCVNLNSLYRSSYPSAAWLQRLRVIEHNFEDAPLPFAEDSFDVVLFTEVLEHIAIKSPSAVLSDIFRVCREGGRFVLSTPNVCNLSNVAALLAGSNVFWAPDLFYGSLDRHNREFTPDEVRRALISSGFELEHFYGFNCHSNWRAGGVAFVYRVLQAVGDKHPLLRNTIMAVAKKPTRSNDDSSTRK